MTPNPSISSNSAKSSCCFAGDTGKNLSLAGTAPSTNWIECFLSIVICLICVLTFPLFLGNLRQASLLMSRTHDLQVFDLDLCEWSIVAFHRSSDGRTNHPPFCLPLLTSTGSGNFWRNVPIRIMLPKYSVPDFLVMCFPDCYRFTFRPFNGMYWFIYIYQYLTNFILLTAILIIRQC